MKVLVIQSRPTLCNSTGLKPSRLLYPWILQARIQKRVAIPFSRGSSWPRDGTWVSCVADRRLPETVFPYPDIWSNTTLAVSVRVLQVSLTFKLIDWVKQIALPQCGCVSSNQLRVWIKQKTGLSLNKREFLLLDWLPASLMLPLDSNQNTDSSWPLDWKGNISCNDF